MVRVRSPQDFGAGLVLSAIGFAGLYFGRELEFGTAARMGPGYFPTLLSWLILLIGVAIAWKALLVAGPRVERIHVRPLVFLIAAIMVFGLIIDFVGLALTTVALTVIAAYARRSVSLTETIVLAAALAVFVVVVFVYGLGQPLPAWWGQ